MSLALRNLALFVNASGVPSAPAELTTEPLKNNTGTLLANETGATAYVHNKTTGALVVKKIGQTTDAAGVMVVSDALMSIGIEYRLVVVLASGAEGLGNYTAA
jgi:hypothetical protein